MFVINLIAWLFRIMALISPVLLVYALVMWIRLPGDIRVVNRLTDGLVVAFGAASLLLLGSVIFTEVTLAEMSLIGLGAFAGGGFSTGYFLSTFVRTKITFFSNKI